MSTMKLEIKNSSRRIYVHAESEDKKNSIFPTKILMIITWFSYYPFAYTNHKIFYSNSDISISSTKHLKPYNFFCGQILEESMHSNCHATLILPIS